MKELTSVLTRKGQVTVPLEVRRKLGLERGDRVAFIVDDDDVRIAARGSVVERTAGAFKSKRPPFSAEQLRSEAEQAMADAALERMRS